MGTTCCNREVITLLYTGPIFPWIQLSPRFGPLNKTSAGGEELFEALNARRLLRLLLPVALLGTIYNPPVSHRICRRPPAFAW